MLLIAQGFFLGCRPVCDEVMGQATGLAANSHNERSGGRI